ncbi:hypothetical protein ABPG77_007988 [Micractinium sp. CCAP 211/92]
MQLSMAAAYDRSAPEDLWIAEARARVRKPPWQSISAKICATNATDRPHFDFSPPKPGWSFRGRRLAARSQHAQLPKANALLTALAYPQPAFRAIIRSSALPCTPQGLCTRQEARNNMAECAHLLDDCDERRVTAPNAPRPGDGELETSTPPREDEGKRRRLSSEMGCTGAATCVRCGSDDCAADSCAAMGRSSSGCSNSSSDTMLVDAVEDEAEPNPLAPGLEEVLRSQLACWGHRLVQLQPKVHMTDHLIECGLYLFKYLRSLQVEAACVGQFPLDYLARKDLLNHDLISCWWIALKHASVRTAVPNRTLMCKATDAHAALLSDRELAALIAIDWEVQAVLKKGGLVL